MVVPDCEYGANGAFVFADSGLVQDPNPEELAAIAASSAESFELLVGEEAKVAMLSHSTMGSAKHALVDKMVEATRIAKEQYPELKLDGELQLDAAIVPSVGASEERRCRQGKRSGIPEPGCRKHWLQACSETWQGRSLRPGYSGYRKAG